MKWCYSYRNDVLTHSKDEVKSDDSDEEAENETVQSLSAPGKSPKIPKHDLTMADEVAGVQHTHLGTSKIKLVYNLKTL